MSLNEMQGLSLDQAPPLTVVFPFFLAASAFATAAGVLLATEGASGLTSPWTPATLAITHLGTIGFLMMVMMGAIYQMTPVVLGAPVPGIRLAHVVFVSMAVGTSALATGLALSLTTPTSVAIAVLGPALLLFLVPTGWAVFRAPAKTETAYGMRYALFCLLAVGLLGVLMAHGHAAMRFPGDRWLFIRSHAALGLLGWVGSLIVAVSWQVVPMFYLAREVPRWQRRVTLGAIVLGTLATPVALLLDPGPADVYVVVAPLPAVLALFVLHPAITLLSIRRRRRKRAHPSLLFWKAGLCTAPAVAIAAVLAATIDEPRWDVLYGFLAVWGWAAVIVHGMLSRIAPFLVWFHRFSPLAGIAPIPSMNSLLPARWTGLGFVVHLASVFAGALGIVTGEDWLLRIAGGLITLAGLSIAATIVRVLSQRPPSAAPG